jgi:uncharacterized protein (TIGR03437 family)
VKIFATTPQAIGGGTVYFTIDGSLEKFQTIVAAEVFSATGDASGIGFVDTVGDFTVAFSSPSGGVGRVPDLPLMELTLTVDKAHTIGIDPSSSFTDPDGNTFDLSANAIQSGSIALGGTLTIQNVTPGGGIVPRSLAIQVIGTGFTSATTVSMDGVSVATTSFISPSLITLTLAAPIEMTGKHLHVQNSDGQQVDYWCWLGSGLGPIFPLISTTSATVGPFEAAPGFVARLEFQNPSSAPVDVTVGTGQQTSALTVPSWGTSSMMITNPGPPGIPVQSITSSAPIRIVGLEIRQFDFSDSFFPAVYAAQQPPLIGSIVNAGSLLQGAVAPGEIITIFGASQAMANFSPPSPTVGAVNGTVVLFDGVPATVLYVSGSQVNAIVPYEVTPQAITSVQVQYNGTGSEAWGVPVASSEPGIFTLDASGQGQAAVVNQDDTINGLLHPAEPGSFISIYATGEGQTSPAGVDAKPAQPPLPQPLLPITVTIGGQLVIPQYAGGAPGEVAGVLQVNAQIPNSIQPGNAVQVVLKVGNSPSQTATIAVNGN